MIVKITHLMITCKAASMSASKSLSLAKVTRLNGQKESRKSPNIEGAREYMKCVLLIHVYLLPGLCTGLKKLIVVTHTR